MHYELLLLGWAWLEGLTHALPRVHLLIVVVVLFNDLLRLVLQYPVLVDLGLVPPLREVLRDALRLLGKEWLLLSQGSYHRE